ncbi:hypothetical protein RQP46_002156 [Phenoliferia psychrophenolica]
MYGVSGSRQGNDWQYGAGDVAWTSFGWSTTPVGSYLDACPGNPGPYHADPLAQQVIPAQIAGCALGIAQVDNIEDTNMDNIVIFSVQPNCVQTKMTSFDIPAMMPACPGGKCICGWFWLPENGQANFFMTAFDCNVTNVSPLATGFAPLTNAVYCPAGDASCGGKTAQRPLYAYNTPTNIVYPAWPYVFNYARPGYHASWGFQNGAQNNIFLPPAAPSVPAVISATSVPSIPAVPATVSAKVVVSVPAVISTTAIPTVNAIVPSVTSVLATTAPVVLATSATTPVPNPKAIASSRAAAAASSSAAAAAAPACTIASKNGSRSRRSIILDQQAANEDLLDQVFEAQEWSSNQIDILSAWIAKKEALRESQ